MTLDKEVDMTKILAVFLLGVLSLSAIEIPTDTHMNSIPLDKEIEVWFRDEKSSTIACRFVGQDPSQGKTHIFDNDFQADTFEEELPDFLDYCEEEIQKRGGFSVGLVAVGSLDPKGLKQYLTKRYESKETENEMNEEAIQLIPSKVKGVDVLLNYPTALEAAKTELDLKKLWVFYLIQFMAENRFKKATLEVDAKWVLPEATKSLLPAQYTVGHGVEKEIQGANTDGRLLKSFLTAMQVLKTRGFTESELADSKSQLIKHLHRFYQPTPSEKTLADYYSSHLAAFLFPCPDYASFMTFSLRLIPEINMGDIAEMLKVSFRDDKRQVVIRYPEDKLITMAEVQAILNDFLSDSLEVKIDEPDKISLVEGKDPFSQLLITDDEQKMIREIIQTVGETSKVKLLFIRSELEKKRIQLLHIHPLRSLASMVTDPYTKQCLAEIMNDYWKRSSFIDDFTKRANREVEDGNVILHLQGFCLAVKANPDQVRAYFNKKEWEKLIKYLIKLNN